jgi:hypothetical protein
MLLKLRKGRYFAGVDIPFVVPNAMIVSKLEELGGEGVRIESREDVAVPFTTTLNGQTIKVDPRKDPRYSDDWAEMVVVDYNGPDRTVDVPRKWKWLMVATPALGQSIVAEAPPKKPGLTTLDKVLLLGALAGAVYGAKQLLAKG